MQHAVLRRLATVLVAVSMTVGVTLPVCADVLVFGGTRGVGLEVVGQLRAQGEGVTVLVRETSDLSALNAIEGVSMTVGDAMNMDAVTRAFASGEFDTAITTLGGTPQAGFMVDSVGNINAIDGALAAGAKRFILVTSIGAGDSRAAAPDAMLKALGMVIAEKEKAERHLIDSSLTWTIIRPGVLNDKPKTDRGVLIQDTTALGVISRAELARLIIDSIDDQTTYGRIFSAIEER